MLFLLLAACFRTPPSPLWEGHQHLVLGDGTGCTIVALHGRGHHPEGFSDLFRQLDLDATVLLPRAPTPWPEPPPPGEVAEGWSWYPSSQQVGADGHRDAVKARADEVAAAIAAPPRPLPEPVIVTGFSQGGVLSFTVATQHPRRIDAALPIGGMLYTSPAGVAPLPITAFHGKADTVVPYDPTRKAVEELTRKGWNATLRSYPGLGHSISPELYQDYARALAKACTP